MRFLTAVTHRKEAPETVSETEEKKKEKGDDGGRTFLMEKLKNPLERNKESQDEVETQRAERAAFIQMLMLATVQDENFAP